MKLSEAFPSSYLKSSDVELDTTYTIAAVTIETLGQGKNAEQKPVISFEETDKTLVCNKTNGKAIAGMYGDEMESWKGKRITLYATEVEYGGEQMMGIRVRMRKPTAARAPEVAATPADPLGKAKTAARNAFDAKWVDFETENTEDGKYKETRWKAAQLAFAKSNQKTVGDLTSADWSAMATEIEKNFDCATGEFLPF